MSSYNAALARLVAAEQAETRALEARIAEARAKEQERAKTRLLSFTQLRNPRFQAGWFHRHLARTLEQFEADCRAQRSPRLIVNVPPQHGKSELCSRSFVPWYLGRNPSHHVILASYSADLAVRMSLEARRAAEEASAWWPELRAGTTWTSDFWSIGGGGSLRAVGIGGGISGMPAHTLVIDDAIKDEGEAKSPATMRAYTSWYETAAYARLQEGGGVLLVNTRWAVNDPTGYHLAQSKLPGVLPWKVIRYPAIATEDEYDDDTLLRRAGEPLSVERFSLQTMQERKASSTPWRWASVYQQQPVPEEGGIFRADHFARRYSVLPALDGMAITVDLTFKGKDTSDFVVMQCWGWKGAICYLIDQRRGRMSYPESKAALVDFRAKHAGASAIIVEDKANGSALVDELRPTMPGIIGWDPGKSDKRVRVEVNTLPRYAAEQVYFPESAPWMHDFITEHLGFLAGAANDDQVDAESQFFAWLASRAVVTTPPAAYLGSLNNRLPRGEGWRE